MKRFRPRKRYLLIAQHLDSKIITKIADEPSDGTPAILMKEVQESLNQALTKELSTG
jgi:hypothetical protein